MKRFIRNSAIWFVAIVLAAIGLDYVISQGLLRMEDYRYQGYHDMLAGIDADVLYMGNSRGFAHFNPAVIDSVTGMKSYNISIGGHPLQAQLCKYHLYRAHNAKPKCLVINVDAVTLRYQIGRGEHESEQFLPPFWDKTWRKDMPEMGYTWADLYIPFYRYYGYQTVIKEGLLEGLHIKHIIKKERMAVQGYHPERGDWDGSNWAAMDSLEGNMRLEDCERMEKLLADCQTEGIQVLLVHTPMYYEAVEHTTRREKLEDYWHYLADTYGAEYWNDALIEMSYDTANFCNASHLNEAAAAIYSRLFAERFKTCMEKQ